MSKKIVSTLFIVAIFSVAMGFLETAVVIYLRELYYPEGFAFPLKILSPNIILTEFLREIATIVMLGGIGIMAGKKNIERFAYFIFSFAVWDIFYYVFLKLLINWPQSLLTWDVLFLVPITWVGSVLAPIINSIMMIVLAISIIYFSSRKESIKAGKLVWALLIVGSVIVLFSYTEEFTRFVLQKYSFSEIFKAGNNKALLEYSCTFVPRYFNWYIFGTGALMHLSAIIIFVRRMITIEKKLNV